MTGMGKNNNSPLNIKFIHNWLTVMLSIKSHLVNVLGNNEEKEKYILLKILYIILHPYQTPGFLYNTREIKEKRDINVILKSTSLVLYIQRYFYVPTLIDYTLMQIIISIKQGIQFVAF